MSIGYYVGGRFADYHPSLRWFFGIILASGLSISVLRLLVIFLLPLIGNNLSITTGPLVSAIMLFFLPGFFLGTLSPFAIKLQKVQAPHEGIGKLSGEVFFWSTFGSIFGTFLAGFFLIPRFGVDQIVIATAFVLIAIGFIGFLMVDRRKMGTLVATLIVFSVVGLIVPILFIESWADAVYVDDGIYERILILDRVYEGNAARFLYLDRGIAGAMFLDSGDSVFEYAAYYLLSPVFGSEIKEALVLGGGMYAVPRALLKDFPNAHVDVVEIEPTLFELSKKYFDLPDNSRLRNHIGDGRRFLSDADKQYDLMFSDVYFSASIPTHFTTQEFFQMAKDKLTPKGLFIANIHGKLLPKPSSFTLAEMKTFRSIFSNSYFFAVQSPTFPSIQNIMFVGYNSEKRIDFTSSEIANHQNEFVRALPEKLIDVNTFDFSSSPLLTDNFAPIEYLVGEMLKGN